MVASKIIEGIPKPHARTAPAKLLDMHSSPYFQKNGPLNIMVASGPFTTNENLDYEPLTALLEQGEVHLNTHIHLVYLKVYTLFFSDGKSS